MNEPLKVGCPVCGGTGDVSYLRSGHWLNECCPGLNGPVDVDSSPLSHELDNHYKRRKARIEYKYPNEKISRGQEFHFIAELDSVRDEWWALFVLVIDDGQAAESEYVKYKWRDSRTRPTWADDEYRTDTIANLGNRIACFLWPEQAAA